MDDSLVERLKTLINEFDPAAFIPEVGSIIGWVELFARVCVMVAPVIMLVLGLIYLLVPPKEANHTLGYRFYFGMGSVEAWRFTQKLAGICWSALGLVLPFPAGFRELPDTGTTHVKRRYPCRPAV